MIQLDHVSKWYPSKQGRHHVLKDVSLTIPSGVNVGIFGRNGAGKSTLIRMIAGNEQINRGRILCDGRVSWPMGIGGGYQGSLTGRQNVRLIGRVMGYDAHAIAQIEDWVLNFSEIGKFLIYR